MLCCLCRRKFQSKLIFYPQNAIQDLIDFDKIGLHFPLPFWYQNYVENKLINTIIKKKDIVKSFHKIKKLPFAFQHVSLQHFYFLSSQYINREYHIQITWTTKMYELLFSFNFLFFGCLSVNAKSWIKSGKNCYNNKKSIIVFNSEKNWTH